VRAEEEKKMKKKKENKLAESLRNICYPLFCFLVAYGYLFATREFICRYIKEISAGTNKIM